MRRELMWCVSLMFVWGLAADVARGLVVKINFQPQGQQVPAGYLPDYGEAFADRGQGYSYGWDEDIQGDARKRGRSTDPRYDTLVQMQEGAPRTWEIALPAGAYNVFVACGDPSYDDQIDTVDLEGKILTDPDGRDNFDEYTAMVTVSDGRLTLKPAPGGTKCKVMFLHITKIEMLKAFNPVPGTGSIHTETSATLTWASGDYAALHKVYFSDRIVDVMLGLPTALQGTQAGTSFIVGREGHPYPDGLLPGVTYYWRIDEVNDLRSGSPWKGDLWSLKTPVATAYDPNPADGAQYVDPNVTLSWTAGFGAQTHTVYLADDFNDVNAAAEGEPQAATSYAPGALDKSTIYYWRVDEFDGVNTHRGPIWRFTTIPSLPVMDPNLLCWWKFDEIFDGMVLDYSGHDHMGIVHGASLEGNGRVGPALAFGGDGDYVVDESAASYLNGLSALTVCLWIKSDQVSTDRGFIDGEEPDGSDQMVTMRYDASGASYGGTNVVKAAVTSTGPWEQQLESSNGVQTTQWQHVAMTWSSGQPLRFYVDGVENTPTGTTAPNEGGVITGCTKLIVDKGGKDQGAAAGWKGLIDDVRIYDIVLTAEDIRQVMRGESDLAWEPSPPNGATPDLKRAMPLTWRAGENAVGHDVYFGADRDAVANGNPSDTTGIYRGRRSETSYTPPEGLDWAGGPYFWRVDEYNTDGTITRGRLWQFTVADFILIDDFESYNDINPEDEGSHRIYTTWIDGWGTTTNGATVGYAEPDFAAGEHFVETDIIHAGRQSMPYFYDNNVGGSEAAMTLVYPRDWTEQDVQVLTLWFRGYPAGFREDPPGLYTVSASGRDIAGTSDEFRFIYRQLTNAGSIQAQVLSLDNTNDWAKAGVMIRRTLEPTSPFAAVYFTPGFGCRFQGRLSLASDVVSDTPVATPEQTAVQAPCGVRIERDNDDNFSGYYSADGVTWTAMAWNPQHIPMPATVYIGLALTSHNVSAVTKTQFANVKTIGSVQPATWTNEAIGVKMPSNDPERMYVALANVNGLAVAAYHPDPEAAQLDTWTRWDIDLKAFSDQGLNLTDVDSIALGFGDKADPKPRGAGALYFDDLRLYRSE